VSDISAPASGRCTYYATLSLLLRYLASVGSAPTEPKLAAFAAAGRRRIGRSRSRSGRGRCTGIILTVIDVSVHPAVVVAIGPHRAGETADRSADDRAFEDADARNDRTGNGAESSAAKRASGDAMQSWVVALRRAGIILAVVDIAVDIAVIVVVCPHGA